MKIINGILLVAIMAVVLWSCSSFRKIYQTPLGLLYVRAFSEMRADVFNKNVSCYYNNFNRFPKDDREIDNFIDSLEFDDYRDSVFFKLQRNYLIDNHLKYTFELKPFTEITKSDTSNFFIDSIKVYKYTGIMIFNDSLLIKNIDSMFVETEVISFKATIFIEEDSIFYDAESNKVLLNNQNKSLGKYSIKNSCIK